MITYTIYRNGKAVSDRTAYTNAEIHETIKALRAADPASSYRFEVTGLVSA